MNVSFRLSVCHTFLPGASFGLRVLSLPACMSLSVNHQLVRAVTQPFKLEPPNLDQRCKRPWLKSLLFYGTIDIELEGQIELQCQNLPHFELVRAISRHQWKSVFPNFGQKCILALFRSLYIWGWIYFDVLFYFKSQTCLFYQNCVSLFICVGLYIFSETIASECCTFHMAPHIYIFLYARGQCRTIDRETV